MYRGCVLRGNSFAKMKEVLHSQASLFGLRHSNRDFSRRESWGKNQFNSSFPAALIAYMGSRGIAPIYIRTTAEAGFCHSSIDVNDLLGIEWNSEDIFYSFETIYTPFTPFYLGGTPRVDLVIQRRSDGRCLRALEIKLTALPDVTTCELDEDRYSCEIVVRPDTISYLACSIASCHSPEQIKQALLCLSDISDGDWTDERTLVSKFTILAEAARSLAHLHAEVQKPLIVQPIWKTLGKSPRLSQHCLDVFVWSDLSVLHLFGAFEKRKVKSIGRYERTLVWLLRMLWDYSNKGQFNAESVIDELSFNTKNDKAFSSNGIITYQFLKSPYLKEPRIQKHEIKYIVLGGGQHLLSPERRFDAILFNSLDIFD